MKVGDYMVRIFRIVNERVKDFDCEEANEVYGYVELKHGTQYLIGINNYSKKKADFTVKIDGKEIGTWRLPERDNLIRVERPINATERFTFYGVDSEEYKEIGSDIKKEDSGVVSVTFIPQKGFYQSPEVIPLSSNWRDGSVLCSDSAKGWGGGQSASYSENTKRGAGFTGLSGKSEQQFGIAELMELDHEKAVTINLRLVTAIEKKAKRLTSISSSNPVPPPVN